MSESNEAPKLKDCQFEEYVLATETGHWRDKRTALLFRNSTSEPYVLHIDPDLGNEVYGIKMTRDQLIDAAIVFFKAANVREFMVDRAPGAPR